MTAQLLPLFDSFGEASTYHDGGHGFFSVLVAHENGKSQSSHRLSEMPKVLDLLDPNRDSWISQAEFFRPNRRVVNLWRLGLLFVDLDTYRISWRASLSPNQLADQVLFFCREEGIPPPSLIIYSGRGIQAKWLLDRPLPQQALIRWNACQRYLVDRLAELCADPAAKDASRVLRVVNTVNTKSGNVCRVIHVECDPEGEPARYNFEYLSEILLPMARWEIEQQREDRAERRQLKLLAGGKSDNLRGFSGQQLAWHRLKDLRTLVAIRGGVTEGERMHLLFWCLNFLLLSGATNSRLMYHEAASLAKEIDPSWTYRSQELMTLYAKAKAYEAGEKVALGSRKFPPLYTPTNETLINLFQISDDEQRQLRTVISSDLAKERHRDREKNRRRQAGAVDRETYESQSLSRQRPWEALGMSRSKWYRVGKPNPAEDGIDSCLYQAARGQPGA